jgi:hypothetical protein
LLEAAADLQALDGRVVDARVIASDGGTVAEARGRVHVTVGGTPPETFRLSFGGRPAEIQRAEYLAGRRLPIAEATLSVSTAGFREAQLQTIDGADYFELSIATNQLRLEITDP